MSKEFFTLDDFDLAGKTVLVRVDINSPINPIDHQLLADTRIVRHLETVRELKDSKVVLLAHQSRPGKEDFVSLVKHAARMSQRLKKKVKFVDDLFGSTAINAIKSMKKGDILLLENIRFYSEEQVLKKKDMEVLVNSHIISKLAPLVDFYVNDAFSAAHRAQPSLIAFPEVLPSMAGRVMQKEIEMLQRAVKDVKRPSIAILGGAKVDDSVSVAKYMLNENLVDTIMTTGVVANIFLMAAGHNLGKINTKFMAKKIDNYVELVGEAGMLLKKFKGKIMMPTDVAINLNSNRKNIKVKNLPTEYSIFDIGLDTIVTYRQAIMKAKNIFLNGPAGVFELDMFSLGTLEIFHAIAESEAFSIIGGGETSAVANRLDLSEDISHISTGGGALISFLAGKKMPAIEALKRSKKHYDNGKFPKCKCK